MEGLKETASKRTSSRGNPYSNAVRKLEALVQQTLGQLAELELEKKELQHKEETLVALVLQQESQLEHIDAVEARKKATLTALNILLDRPPSLVSYRSPFALQTGSALLDPESTAVLETETARFHEEQQQQQQQQASLGGQSCPSTTAPTESPFGKRTQFLLQPGSSICTSSRPNKAYSIPDKSRLVASDSAVAGGQYVHQLLSNASPEQWECAMTWGKEEWGTYFCQLVMHISLLMEMIRAGSGTPGGSAAGSAATATPAAAVTASTQPDQTGSCTISSQHILSAAQAIAAASPASTRVGGVACQVLPGPSHSTPPSTDVSSWLEHLEQLVDDFVCKICLTLSYNNIGVREASVIDYSSFELVNDIPPEHWQQVADAIQMSSRQIQQLSVAWQGYCRSMTHIVVQQQAIKQAVDAVTDADADVLGPVTALKLAAVEQVQQMLGAHLAVWANAANVVQFFAANTLTKMQIAQFLVASYPYFPRIVPVLAVVCEPQNNAGLTPDSQQQRQQAKLLQERHMQQLRQQNAQLEQQNRIYWERHQQLLQPLGLHKVLFDGGEGLSGKF